MADTTASDAREPAASSYDDLTPDEQAAVREGWVARMSALAASLDFAAVREAAGKAYSESDDDGNVVIHLGR